jgi:hypothetical protein
MIKNLWIILTVFLFKDLTVIAICFKMDEKNLFKSRIHQVKLNGQIDLRNCARLILHSENLLHFYFSHYLNLQLDYFNCKNYRKYHKILFIFCIIICMVFAIAYFVENYLNSYNF